MMIEIEGTRASDQAKRRATALTVVDLFRLAGDQIAWRTPDDPGAVKLARRLYAEILTLPELNEKCAKVASLVSDWLSQHEISGSVELVRLRCLQSLFEITIDQDTREHHVEIREELLDELLTSGSREAAESLDRLFWANFGRFARLKAS